MRLYLARHGEAGAAATDDLRQLTPQGREVCRDIYQQAQAQWSEPLGAVIASPLVRAQQTAQIALSLLPTTATEVLTSSQLRPESTPESVCQLLDKQPHWPVLLVAHQPLLGLLLSWLTGDDILRYGVNTSSLFALDLITPARGCASLAWQLG